MGPENAVGRLRALLAPDLAARRFRAFDEYLAEVGAAADGHQDALRAEYDRLVLPAALAVGAAPQPATGDFAASPPPGGPDSPLPRVVSPDGTDSAIDALTALPPGLTEHGEIARGGMGAVLRVHDDLLRRELAMKVALDEPKARSDGLRRFVGEAQIQAQLDHPGVAPVHHLGRTASGRICFTMKLVKGRSLEEVIERVRDGKEPLNLARGVQWLLRVCETVGFAHEKGVVHRDLKPGNVMIGSFGEVYVMDWGLARVLGAPDLRASVPRSVVLTGGTRPAPGDARLTREGEVLGTPAYMSPEQAQGRSDAVDARSDVYSLGAILYELLAGFAPYCEPGRRRNGIEIIRAAGEGPPVAIPRSDRAPEELVSVAEKAMSRSAADRYPNARAMAEDLQRWIEGRVVRAHRTGAFAELRKWVRRNRAVAAAFAVTGLAIAGASIRYTILEQDAQVAIRKERDAALAARDEARLAARRTLGTKLAGDAILDADRDPARAAALALEAAERAPGPRSVDALYAAIRNVAEVRTLTGHQGYVEFGAWSPDGSRAWTADRSGLVIAWRTSDAKETARAQAVPAGDDELGAFDVSLDGRRIAVAGARGGVRTFDAATLAAAATIDTRGAPAGGVALSPDGSRVAVTFADGGLGVFDAASGAATADLAGFGGAACGVAWSPDGRRVASRNTDLAVCIADAVAGRAERVIALADEPLPPADQRPARTVAWAADGTRVVAWSAPMRGRPGPSATARVRVFDAATGAGIGDGSGARGSVVAFAPDRRSAFVARETPGLPPELRVLDVVTGAESRGPVERAEAAGWRPLAVRPDGRAFASPDRDYAVSVRTTAAGIPLQRLAGHSYQIGVAAFSPDGKTLLTGSNDRSVRLWDVAPSRVRRGAALRAAPDRSPIVQTTDAEARLAGVWWRNGDVPVSAELVDTATGDVVWTAEHPADWVTPSADGRRVAVSGEGRIDVIDVATRRRIARFELPGAEMPRFDTTGRRVAVQSSRGPAAPEGDHVYVFDVESPGAPLVLTNPEPGGDGSLRGGAWSHDGTRYAAALGYDGPIVWDARTGAVVGRFPGHTGMIIDVAFSPDGARIASQAMDTTVRVWDVASGAQLARCTVPMRTGRVAFSADGGTVAFVHPAALALFEAATGRAIARIAAGEVPFADRIAVTAAGDYVTADRGGSVRLWPSDPERWVRENVSRRLTDAERAEAGIDDAPTTAR